MLRDALLEMASADWSDPHGDEAVWRVSEHRALFANETQARFSLPATIRTLTNASFEELSEAPPLGEDGHAFVAYDAHKPHFPVSAYAFVFRVARVVVGVKVITGSRAQPGALTLAAATDIARRAATRTANAQK